MKKRNEKIVLNLCLLVILVSCNSPKQIVQSDNRPERVLSLLAAEHKALTRQEEIPLMQIDASAVFAGMVNYVEPEAEIILPQQVTEKLTAYIAYPPDGVAVDPLYGNNRAELTRLKQQLEQLLGEGNSLQSIRLTGFASPDGNTGVNERLAGNRAICFKNYLQQQLSIHDKNQIAIDWIGEDWAGLREQVAASGRTYSNRVLAILDRVSDADERRGQLKALDNGSVYKDMEKSFFARLRRMELHVVLNREVPVKTLPGHDLIALSVKMESSPEEFSCDDLLSLATLYRPGTEQYREVYELAAYRFPDCRDAQLNAAAASLALGDEEAAELFLEQAGDDPRSWNNRGVLCLMKNEPSEAVSWFSKSMSQNPRLARCNIRIARGH